MTIAAEKQRIEPQDARAPMRVSGLLAPLIVRSTVFHTRTAERMTVRAAGEHAMVPLAQGVLFGLLSGSGPAHDAIVLERHLISAEDSAEDPTPGPSSANCAQSGCSIIRGTLGYEGLFIDEANGQIAADPYGHLEADLYDMMAAAEPSRALASRDLLQAAYAGEHHFRAATLHQAAQYILKQL